MSDRVTEWFVEPLDDHTNEVIVRALTESGGNDQIQTMRDDDERPHQVFSVDHPFIARLQRSAANNPGRIKFKVFNRQTKKGPDYGPIREWQFEKRSRPQATVTTLGKK